MANIQNGRIITEEISGSYGNRTPGHLGVLSNVNSPRAGGPSSESEANLPRPRIPGHLGREADAGVIGRLKAVAGPTGSGPQLITSLKSQSFLTPTMGPGSNALPESGKPIQQQKAQPKSGSSMKK